MQKKIQFIVRSNEENLLHEDFKMIIPSLSQELVFDTYYLVLGKYINGENQLIKIVNEYLDRCKKTILQMNITQMIYLPIDISDQYYGAFKIRRVSSYNFIFEYGTVLKTTNTLYDLSTEFINISINDEIFDIDFDIGLTQTDIKLCFSL